MKDSFSDCHPAAGFLYFLIVISFTMIFMHPVIIACSLFGAAAYSVCLNGKRAVKFNLTLLPLVALVALINPLFNHAGATMLFSLPDGNPVTLESIIYGVNSAFMFLTVIIWFSCFNAVMTSDKIMVLFGKIIPTMSLVLCMVFRLVPKFKTQIKMISDAQKCIGRDVSNGTLIQKIKHGVTIFSILITWAFENAIETGDSMKSRGYGHSGRTAYSDYRMNTRDVWFLVVFTVLAAVVIVCAAAFGIRADFFPSFNLNSAKLQNVPAYLSAFILFVFPFMLNLRERAVWSQLKSKI